MSAKSLALLTFLSLAHFEAQAAFSKCHTKQRGPHRNGAGCSSSLISSAYAGTTAQAEATTISPSVQVNQVSATASASAASSSSARDATMTMFDDYFSADFSTVTAGTDAATYLG